MVGFAHDSPFTHYNKKGGKRCVTQLFPNNIYCDIIEIVLFPAENSKTRPGNPVGAFFRCIGQFLTRLACTMKRESSYS